MSSQPVVSPLSEVLPEKLKDLPSEFLRRAAAAYFSASPPAAAFADDFTMYRCRETGLEFAWPMRAGNGAYYDWLASVDKYFPVSRWEYGEVLRRLHEAGVSPCASLIDVGGGSGHFATAAARAGYHVTVTDLSRSAVEACRAHGLVAFEGDFRQLVESNRLSQKAYEVVTCFHCLEHVEEPVKFVQDLLRLGTRGARVFISTPCSPMHFEVAWFDPQNHPPHHLTRWTPIAYQKLARILDAECLIYMPTPNGAIRRALSSLKTSVFGPRVVVPRMTTLAAALAKPSMSWQHLRAQSRRMHYEGKPCADVILVEFRWRNAIPPL